MNPENFYCVFCKVTVFQFQRAALLLTNTSCVFYVETTWKRSFQRGIHAVCLQDDLFLYTKNDYFTFFLIRPYLGKETELIEQSEGLFKSFLFLKKTKNYDHKYLDL